MDDPTVYPRLTTWFEELDNGPRGSDGHNFAQYAASLEENGYKRLFQLEKLIKDDLLMVCDGLLPGTASLILDYARKDAERIRKRETKRLREIRHQAKRYK